MKTILPILVLMFLLNACRETALPAETVTPPPSPGKQSPTPWQEDLDTLIATIKDNHPNAFHNRPEESFLEEAKKIREALVGANDSRSMVELMRLAASIGDAHTLIYPSETTSYETDFLWLKEGLFLLHSPDEIKEHLGKKLVAVDGRPIEEVTAKLKTVISHENEQWVKSRVQSLLRNNQVLYGLSLTDKPEEVNLSLEDRNGHVSIVNIKSIQSAQRPNIHYSTLKSKSGKYPMNYINNVRFYWYSYMTEHQTLYIQYNKCQDSTEQSVEEFVNEIKKIIKSNPIRKVMIDLRNNSGGNSLLIRPLMSAIISEEFNQPDRLFVFIGKDTFSSGMKNAVEFRKWTKATLVGEPTGGKPNAYGDVKLFQLPHSNLQGQYSTKFFTDADVDQPSLLPDILIEPSIQEWIQGRDFCLEYALQAKDS